MADPYGYTASGGMGVSLPPPPGSKRNRRMRSVQGQLGGGDQKKGRGAAAKDQEFLELERSGAPPFLISKQCIKCLHDLYEICCRIFTRATLWNSIPYHHYLE